MGTRIEQTPLPDRESIHRGAFCREFAAYQAGASRGSRPARAAQPGR